MNKKHFFLLLFLVLGVFAQAQIADTTAVAIDSASVDMPLILPENGIQNSKAIGTFLKKLSDLQTNNNGKINIVHIGDSHIQADLMTNKVRKKLQSVFGNAGRGFVFPHNLAKTNGAWDIKFSSNASWENHRIISPTNGSKVGLSGIALATKSNNFSIEFNAKEADNYFTTIKIVTPKNENNFDFSLDKRIVTSEKKVPKKVVHKIKNGEAISIIADKYNISIAALKKANGLKSDKIRAGKTLKIPTSGMQIQTAERSEYIALPMLCDANTQYFKTDKALEKIYIIPHKSAKEFNLNGVILENNSPGILYHNIGVNGAKFSDYNKYDLFFEQLKALQPDLIIISLGTNESFDKMKSEDYLVQLDLFLQNVKSHNPNAEILITSAPPSLFQRKYPNFFVADYAQKISNLAVDSNYAFWDMYAQLGGLYGVRRNFNQGLMANDRVHYSKLGYEKQGNLLSEAILKAFEVYQNSIKQ